MTQLQVQHITNMYLVILATELNVSAIFCTILKPNHLAQL